MNTENLRCNVDVPAPLRDKLTFILRFYEIAAQPFLEAIQKIEKHEEPYVAYGEPTNDEPPFPMEWLEAKESLNILGQSCLCLIQASLKEFLIAFIRMSRRRFPDKQKGKSWFEVFQKFFLETYGTDWTKLGIDLSLIEQVNLARNDIQHEGRPYDLARMQNEQHAKRFPNSIFASELDRAIFQELSKPEPCRIEVTREGLTKATEVTEEFCSRIVGEA